MARGPEHPREPGFGSDPRDIDGEYTVVDEGEPSPIDPTPAEAAKGERIKLKGLIARLASLSTNTASRTGELIAATKDRDLHSDGLSREELRAQSAREHAYAEKLGIANTRDELVKGKKGASKKRGAEKYLEVKRDARAQKFAEEIGLGEERNRLNEVAEMLEFEYKREYSGMGGLKGLASKHNAFNLGIGKKSEKIAAAEQEYAKASKEYHDKVMGAFEGKNISEGPDRAQYLRAVAFKLRDTVNAREVIRTRAREAALDEKGRTLVGSAVKWSWRAGKAVNSIYSATSGAVGRGVAIGSELVRTRGKGDEKLSADELARFKRLSDRYARASRIATSAGIATLLTGGAAGVGAGIAAGGYRLGKGVVGGVLGTTLAKYVQKYSTQHERKNAEAFRNTRRQAVGSEGDILAQQEAFKKGERKARHNRTRVLGMTAGIVGGAGLTGAGGAALESWADDYMELNRFNEALARGVEDAHSQPEAGPSQVSPVSAAPETAAAPAAAPTESVSNAADTPAESPSPEATSAIRPPSIESGNVVIADAADTPIANPDPGITTVGTPSSETVPAASVEASSNVEQSTTGAEAQAGDGFDRLFGNLRTQLEAQYPNWETNPDTPDSVRHILEADSPNALSREFGFAWDEASAENSATVHIGDRLELQNGQLILVPENGEPQTLLNAEGERTYTHVREEEPVPPTTPERTAAPAPSSEPESAPVTTSPTESRPEEEECPPDTTTAPSSSEERAPVEAPAADEPVVADPIPASPPAAAPRMPLSHIPTLDEYMSQHQQEIAPEAPAVQDPHTPSPEGAPAAFTNSHGTEVDPTRTALYEWRVPGERNLTTTVAFGENAERIARHYVEGKPNDPSAIALFRYVDRNPLTGFETVRLDGWKWGSDGALVHLRDIHIDERRNIVPQPEDFVRRLNA